MSIHTTIPSMWRYVDMLPLRDERHRISLGEGWTPLIEAPRTAAALGHVRLLIKDEGRNPTGSFKDRSASWTISRLQEQRAVGVVLHSTGNAGAAFATYAARAGMACVSFVPRDVLEANVAQMLDAGARVEMLDDWSAAPNRAAALATDLGYVDVSTGRTTLRAEGKQTLAAEIVEQLDGRFPDFVVCPTGGGTAVLALHRAFEALRDAGAATGPLPRLVISQYTGCAPIVAAHRAGDDTVRPWSRIETPRGGMRTAKPGLGREVLAAIRDGGAYAIDPGVARKSCAGLAANDGIAIGLEGGTALAAAEMIVRDKPIASQSTIVVVNTATALKSDPAYRAGAIMATGCSPKET